MPNLLNLSQLLERYDEKKIATLVKKSRDYNNIKGLVDVIKIDRLETREELDKIGAEIYGTEQWEEIESDVKKTLEKARNYIEKNEFIEEIRSVIHATFIQKSFKGNLDDVIDSFIRSIIKNKAIDILKKDKLLRNFVSTSAKTFKFVMEKDDDEDEVIIDVVSPDLNPEEMAENNEEASIFYRNLLKLNNTDQIIVGLLTKLGFKPEEIAELWPKPITNQQIQQIKQGMIRNLKNLVKKDTQYRELRKLGVN
jgi:hypothetical protein